MEDRHMEESLDALRPTESPAETVPSSEPETIANCYDGIRRGRSGSRSEEVTRVPNPYADSFLANEDMGAWLQIPGTGIDYPVMWTREMSPIICIVLSTAARIKTAASY